MRTPQLLSGIACAALLMAGCNRADADRDARAAASAAASEVRTVAAEAGGRISDGWLTSKVQAQYFVSDQIKARYVDVSTRDAVVTLSGYVDSIAAREEAVRIAKLTDGVKDVEDKLLIGVAPAKETFSASTATPGAAPTTGTDNNYEATVAANAAAAGGDERITSMVQARFFLDPAIKARVIDVQTRNGVVTLRGALANEQERAQALLIARHTNGVGRVEDLLTVGSNVQ